MDPKVVRQLNPTLKLNKPLFTGADWGLGDFGDVNYRIKRASEEILPSFLVYRKDAPDAVKDFINKRANGQ